MKLQGRPKLIKNPAKRTIVFEQQQWTALETTAGKQRLSINELIRRFVDAGLQREKTREQAAS